MLLKRGANRDLKSTEGKSVMDFGENLFSIFEIYYFDYNSFLANELEDVEVKNKIIELLKN